jgi:hypothetical protein
MKSIFDPTERAHLTRRLRTLRSETAPRWGRMTAHQMVCHLYDAVDSAEKPAPAAPGTGILSRFPVKQLVRDWVPWPKGRLQSPPDLLATQPADWSGDLDRLITAVERVAARGAAGVWPASEVFGELTGRQWGGLLRTHINHHLRQFGA